MPSRVKRHDNLSGEQQVVESDGLITPSRRNTKAPYTTGKENIMNRLLRTLQLWTLACITTGCFLTTGCNKKSQPAPPPPQAKEELSQQKSTKPQAQPEEPEKPEWGVAAHFGTITTVWISEQALRDKFQVAQILHQIDQQHGKNAVWFFDSKQYTPKGVPMTDQQMLHWVGLYDPAQSETFSYVEVTDRNTSPPKTKMTKTTIRPGYTD